MILDRGQLRLIMQNLAETHLLGRILFDAARPSLANRINLLYFTLATMVFTFRCYNEKLTEPKLATSRT